ncbi:glycosyltransferase family 39 protein [Tumidithrix elongata RA019]|uniref:Glycosyltransferase family 39 protein n=1 Tax=Tumidithrix elongata BACA0141 TaxID=2716417 RepID=A0AAW9PZK3_9CYAN|nr:glycosyltransferase family 39 protein [Tumidithrix elongata RA019]
MQRRILSILLAIAIAIGIGFRFTEIDRKLYSYDEVHTSLRSAGYTTLEIAQEIFSDRFYSPKDLLKYQQLKPNSTLSDTVRSLALEDPQHPPLYYALSRYWMQFVGSDIASMRLPAILLSLLGLPLMYGLAMELFGNSLVALLAVAFLALSPFDVLYSQIARQYSLLTVMAIASSFCLLRVMRQKTLLSWGVYAVTNAIGLYTHPFFSFTIVGHGVYAFLLYLWNARDRRSSQDRSFFLKYLGSVGTTLILYSPWIVVLVGNYQRALSGTSWTGSEISWLIVSKLWMLSFTALFLDLDVGFDNVWTYIFRLPIFGAIVAGLYLLYRRTSQKIWLFVLTSIFVPFLMLVLPDIILGGHRSSVSRYLIPCFPAVQLAVAYLLATNLEIREPQSDQTPKEQVKEEVKSFRSHWFWRSALALLFTCSIASCSVSALSNTWWSNEPSHFNAEVADQINAMQRPLLLIDEGEGINVADLFSVNYRLQDKVKLQLLSFARTQKPPELSKTYSDWLVFRPSGKLRLYFQAKGQELEVLSGAGGLWRVPRTKS